MWWLARLGLVVVLMSAVSGCTDEVGSGSARGCSLNTDCPLPESCIDGRCALECRADRDCPAGEQCIDSLCVDPFEGCTTDADCRALGAGLVCDLNDRRCVPLDAFVLDQGAQPRDMGQFIDGLPILDAEPDTAAPDRGVDMSRPPVDMSVAPDRAVPPPDMRVVEPDMGPAGGNAPYGDPCQCAADCASGFCLQNPYTGVGQCTALCGGARVCEGIDRCVQARVPGIRPGCPDPGTGVVEGQVVEICAPNETGVPCRGPADCLIDGTCITPPNPLAGQVPVQASCGARCVDDRGCPAGYRCQAVPVQGGGQVQVCGAAVQVAACPDGSNGSCGGVCPLAAGVDPLDVSHCLVIDAGPGGYCSCSCRTSADCPLGFACSPGVIDTGDPTRPNICLPMAGFTCPQGEAQCLSLMCIPPTAPTQASAQCSAPCTGPQDCPSGYDCVAAGGGLNVCAAR